MVAQSACSSGDLRDKKGNTEVIRFLSSKNNSKLFLLLKNLTAPTTAPVFEREAVKAKGGTKARWQTMFLWKLVRRMLNSCDVLVR